MSTTNNNGRHRLLASGRCAVGLFGAAFLAIALAVPAGGAPLGSRSPGLKLAAVERTTAKAARHVAFIGHYHGTASLLINNGSVSIPSVNGTGTGTLVGKSSVAGTGSSSASAQCDPFAGKGTITGASGQLRLSVVQSKSSGCSNGESGPVTVTFHGVAVITSATGVLKGATGSLKLNGTLNLKGTSGTQNGPYVVTLTGELSLKG
jgi:hypothetical protein